MATKAKTPKPLTFITVRMAFEQPFLALNENSKGDYFFNRDVNAPVITEAEIRDFISADDPTAFEITQNTLKIPHGTKATVQHIVYRTEIRHAEVLPAGCKLEFLVTAYTNEGIDAINRALSSKNRLAPFETENFGRFTYTTTSLDNPETNATNILNRLTEAIK